MKPGFLSFFMLMLIMILTGCQQSDTSIHLSPVNLAVLWVYSSPDAEPVLTYAHTTYQQISHPSIQLNTDVRSHQQLVTTLKTQPDLFFLSYQPLTSDDMHSIPLLQDGLALIAHPDNPVHNLTITQIRRIYQGFITNWSDIGGDDQEIHALSPRAGSDTRMAFEQMVMGKRPLSSQIIAIPDSQSALEHIQTTPGALAFIPAGLLSDQIAIKVLSVDDILPYRSEVAAYRYPLRMTLFINSAAVPDAAMTEFIKFLQQPHRYLPAERSYTPLIASP